MDPWRSPQGQHRGRPLSETLRLARQAAERHGVTRLAETTGLDRIGVPVFQAVRPLARSLSVSQGKGLTPMAAMVSALLESIEFAVAEALPSPRTTATLEEQGPDATALWSTAPRPPLALRLAPTLARGWMEGHDLATGARAPVPWDLVSLDFTLPRNPDLVRTSVGLATGNSPEEARVGAVAELIEHDLMACWGRLPMSARMASELDLHSVEDPAARMLLRRIERAGCRARVWSLGQDWGIAAFRCIVTDETAGGAALGPVLGSGCHPDRAVALIRALLEAIQVRVTLIAGARDDLTQQDYDHVAERTTAVILENFSLRPGALPWRQTPHQPSSAPDDQLASLLDAVRRRTPLPVLAVTLDPPVEGLAIVRAVAPGLEDPDGAGTTAPPLAAPRATAAPPPCSDRIVLFVGPSLPRALIPPSIEVRPPATCGDLAALLAEPPAAVGLVDGCFEIAPTVWHKEILDLLAHGVAVVGGASLGAIRAAELHTLGMTGVGRVFEAYRDGGIRRDDAVMLVHAPRALGSAPLSLSLVEAEDALERVAMPSGERRLLQRIVRTTSFRERSWDLCLAEFARRRKHAATAAVELRAIAPSIKHADSLALIDALVHAAAPARSPPPARPPLTSYYLALLGEISRGRPTAAPA